MKIYYLGIILFFFICNLEGQDTYFQQKVDYKIDVRLDEISHKLIGSIKIQYANNSPVALDKLYMHLWPNAYSSKNTAFAKQALELGMTNFHFAPKGDIGGIDSLDFKINGQKTIWKLDGENPDIALIILDEEILPGASVEISTPFVVKIPKSYSRMGREGNSYQITQWYPKPAVYDNNGWHPMPYLAMGEFYAEFGTFDVTLDVPDNFVIAATGELITAGEKSWHDKLSQGENNTRSSTNRKTIQYKQENVHDFAWFANPNFKVKKSNLTIANNKVEVITFTTDIQQELWQKANDYTADAIKFFSDKIGHYQYQQYSVVQAPLQAGGGMEYPTITVIDKVSNEEELHHVIAHEVGHNWFQGVLGFDERTHPWMDEGMTTYYDHRYINYALQTEDRFNHYLPSCIGKNVDLPLMNYAVLSQSHRCLDQAVNTPSTELSINNYVLNAYMKPTLAFQYLEDYLGTDKMDQIISSFYDKWKFKHPSPQNLREEFESMTDKDLNWFFDGLINSNGKIDYKLKSQKHRDGVTTLEIENKGDINAPYTLGELSSHKDSKLTWQEGHKNIEIVTLANTEKKSLSIDPAGRSLDINRYNNIKESGLLRGWKELKYKAGVGLDDDTKRGRFVMPIIGFNAYDGLMIGLSDHSAIAPNFKVQDNTSIFYGLGSGSVVGDFNLRYNFYWDDTKPKQLTIGFNGRTFHYNDNKDDDYDLRYAKIQPYISYRVKPNFKHPTTHTFSYHLNNYKSERPVFVEKEYVNNAWNKFAYNQQLRYRMDKVTALFPHSVELMLEYENYQIETLDNAKKHNYLNLSFEWDSKFMYAQDKSIGLRVFYSKFLINTQRGIGSTNNSLVRGTRSLSYQGFTDNYEELFLGRSDQSSFWTQQVLIREGGFKYTTGSSFSNLGQSNDYIASINLTLDAPIKLPKFLPISFYFDAGIYNSKKTTLAEFESKALYSGGIQLTFADDIFEIYIPIFNSSEIDGAYNSLDASFFRKIGFNINLQKMSPWKLIDRVGW